MSDEVNSRSQQKRIAALKGEPYPDRNEQLAREWFETNTNLNIVESVAALLARRALEEAKWWKLQIESRIHGINFYQHMNFDVADKIELERIAALEQAAASKAAGLLEGIASKLAASPAGRAEQEPKP